MNAKIERIMSGVDDQKKLNMQLMELHDNHCHYRKWAETELTQAHGVIRRQQLEIKLLNQSAGKDPFLAGVYGLVSTEN